MISYEPLTNTLKERNMKRSDLRQHMSSATIAKLANNEFLSLKMQIPLELSTFFVSNCTSLPV